MNVQAPHVDSHSSGPWYADGLRFGCTRCGKCCGGAPGFVWVTPHEIAQVAQFLGLAVEEFARLYCRNVWFRVSFKERANGDCVFLTLHGCAIYPVRPLQCRTFPFWPDNLLSPSRWEALSRVCPGIGRGRLYSCQEIEAISRGLQKAE